MDYGHASNQNSACKLRNKFTLDHLAAGLRPRRVTMSAAGPPMEISRRHLGRR